MRKYTLFFLLFITAFIPLEAQETAYKPISDVAAIEKVIASLTKGITSIQSDFVQTKHLDALEMEIVSDGKLHYRSDNSLRWEYITPFSYTIASFDGKFTIKNGAEIKAYDIESNLIFREINSILIKSVNGSLLSDDNFTVEAFQHPSEGYKFVLIPHDEILAKALSKIELFWGYQQLTVSHLRMVEDANNYTIIQFKNERINAILPDSIFTIIK